MVWATSSLLGTGEGRKSSFRESYHGRSGPSQTRVVAGGVASSLLPTGQAYKAAWMNTSTNSATVSTMPIAMR